MTRRDHLDREVARQMESILIDLAASSARTPRPATTPSRSGSRPVIAFVVVLVLLLPVMVFALTNDRRRSTPADPTVPTKVSPTGATIGKLPARTGLDLHGSADLAPLDDSTKSDLRTLAGDTNQAPETVLRDYATQPAFDAVLRIAQNSPNFVDAVYKRGRTAASIIRFKERPAASLLAILRNEYPGELRIEWGKHLINEDEGNLLSSTVFRVIEDLPGTEGVLTGIDGDERVNASYAGTADIQSVVNALLSSPKLRAYFIDGQPPTEIRVAKGSAQPVATPGFGPGPAATR